MLENPNITTKALQRFQLNDIDDIHHERAISVTQVEDSGVTSIIASVRPRRARGSVWRETNVQSLRRRQGGNTVGAGGGAIDHAEITLPMIRAVSLFAKGVRTLRGSRNVITPVTLRMRPDGAIKIMYTPMSFMDQGDEPEHREPRRGSTAALAVLPPPAIPSAADLTIYNR
ncbi:hypothetical protein EVAR_7239_1 [Eumeta japonica]|uniref:Uncharacterized protein n=1 Tax=Eumeta variegata TaxID=151549 RepID=A0A4C1T3C1_EUMVA|nr:hypothetical protein EVAR_7239_1 [Eumeta japonica]